MEKCFTAYRGREGGIGNVTHSKFSVQRKYMSLLVRHEPLQERNSSQLQLVLIACVCDIRSGVRHLQHT
jgi:hypothetical protein